MRPELDTRGVKVVTISTDTPEELKRGRQKHALQATMLSDHDLAATDCFGLRNQGVHSGIPGVTAPALPIPTALLFDAQGIVVWMDQAENYQRRSDPDYVLGSVKEQLA